MILHDMGLTPKQAHRLTVVVQKLRNGMGYKPRRGDLMCDLDYMVAYIVECTGLYTRDRYYLAAAALIMLDKRVTIND